MSRFRAGELVLLVDRKKRRYLIDLVGGGSFHSHAGLLSHDDIIDNPPGISLTSSLGAAFIALRPTLSDFILKMNRGAQVIYPKDLGAILMTADIFSGAHVVEAGMGSGALTMTLLRAVGNSGLVTSYEVREDHAKKAEQNIQRFFGKVSNHRIHHVDISEGIREKNVDRVLLDLPEPWEIVPLVVGALIPGGILLTYLPTIPQVQHTVETMEEHNFELIETLEVLHRGWNIAGSSVRPNHRMVAHTGFLTTGRLILGTK